jgi:oligoribonuclease
MLSMSRKSRMNLVWIDLEMTGLNPDVDRILEMATIVTDGELNVLAEGPELVIHQSEAVLSGMDDWNRRTHGASGLVERVRASTVTEAEAERLTLDFLKPYIKERTSPLCGNSIHQDRRFISRYMTSLDAFLHYRLIDVSSLKELARRWYPPVFDAAPRKSDRHRALDDIRGSIAELQYYRQALFVPRTAASAADVAPGD